MENLIIAVILLIILGAAIGYIIKAKKNGQKCIGCPASKTCGKKCCSCSDENNK
ncbi:MAG: FeoB-associated Cys-rich membrane protein [Clostridia bacterium]|nr:FeoB-associated Cys-rich membrane protein [Clostridia bacterium]